MTLRILVDECLQDGIFVALLSQAGHDVVTVNDEGLASLSDVMVLQRAIDANRFILTNNCIDFIRLTENRTDYPGLLLVYTDNRIRKDLTYSEIVKAIAKLEESQVPIRNQNHNLNFWR